MSIRVTPEWLAAREQRIGKRLGRTIEQSVADHKQVKGIAADHPVETVRIPKPNKFGAQKAEVDGVVFDSKHEAERYRILKLEAKAGEVTRIVVHKPLQVHVNGVHVFTYYADFAYLRRNENGSWLEVHEDAKGYRKGAAYQLFRLKKTIIAAALAIEIEEV